MHALAIGTDVYRIVTLADGRTIQPRTQLTVVGYATHYAPVTNRDGLPHGIYLDLSQVKVRDYHGNVTTLRSQELVAADGTHQKLDRHSRFARTGDLPASAFLEGDWVTVTDELTSEAELLVVKRVAYELAAHTTDPGRGQVYVLAEDPHSTGRLCFDETSMQLIEPGNVRRYLDGDTLEFADLDSEAAFWRSIPGASHRVYNAGTHTYLWTLDQALDAIESAVGDDYVPAGHDKNGQQFFELLRYRDAELGDRIGTHLLNEHDDEADLVSTPEFRAYLGL